MRHWITRGPLPSLGAHGEVICIVSGKAEVPGVGSGSKDGDRRRSNGNTKHLTVPNHKKHTKIQNMTKRFHDTKWEKTILPHLFSKIKFIFQNNLIYTI